MGFPATATARIGIPSYGEACYLITVTSDDMVWVTKGLDIVTKQRVEGLDQFWRDASWLAVGWGQLPDFEVIYLYDRGDDYFGYAINLQDPGLSEWGYAPFS